MSADKWEELYRRMKINTKNDRLSWRETTDEGVFITSVDRLLIEIKKVVPESLLENDYYHINIMNREGKTLDEFTSDDLDRGQGRKFYNDMEDFVKSIKRKLSGAEAVLDELIAKLPDPDEIPF